MRNLPRVFTPYCPADTRTRDPLIASPTFYRNTMTPPSDDGTVLLKVKVVYTCRSGEGLEHTITNQQTGDINGKPSGKLLLLPARPTVIFPAAGHRCLCASTKL